MRVINTIDNILDCFIDEQFKLVAWEAYIEENSLDVKEKCKEDVKEYDFDKDIIPVLNNVIQNKEKLETLNHSFTLAIDVLRNNLIKLFDSEAEIDIILYLGLCNGAGWATTIRNRNTILLGIEKIIELDWQDEVSMQALIFHEIGHIWHDVHGNLYPKGALPRDKSLVQLYQEGVAMRCEQFLCQNDYFYHQDKNGWLHWCDSNLLTLKEEYKNRIYSNRSTQDFFGDWCDYQGYSDVGYYLGCKFIKFLENDYTLLEIIKFDITELKNAFASFSCKQ